MGDLPAIPAVRWRIRRLEDVDSTNRLVLDEARAGAEAGLVVVADHQHAGRGRRGRVWTAPARSSLLVSVLLRPTLVADELHVITMAAALALLDAVHAVAGVTAELKWPNDLVVGDRKLAGLLAEADLSAAGAVRAVVVGVGCNVTWAGYPAELEPIATACDREAGHAVERDALLGGFLDRFATRLAGLDRVPGDYRAHLATIGRRVRVEFADRALEGVATDVDEIGRLAVRGADGAMAMVAAGDVVHLRPVTGPRLAE
jgi:BirA family biotin operon repressor/biotin-[acetyl-CoA-carboxylase] ligase